MNFDEWCAANGHGGIDDMLMPLERSMKALMKSAWNAAVAAEHQQLRAEREKLRAEVEALRNQALVAAGKTAMRCIEMAKWPQGLYDEQAYYGGMFAEFIEKEFRYAIDAALKEVNESE